MTEIRIGISGWTYPPWRGDFYPPDLPHDRELEFAMVVADTAGKWPLIEDVAADFIYLRLHGAEELYASGYTEPALDEWARKIRRWSQGGTPENAKLLTPPPPAPKQGRDVFTYFDNDVKTHAPLRRHLARQALRAGTTLTPFTNPPFHVNPLIPTSFTGLSGLGFL